MMRILFLAGLAALGLLAGCISVDEREIGAVRVVSTTMGACCSASHHTRLVSSRGGELLDHLGTYVVSPDARWMLATRSKEGEEDPHLYVVDLRDGTRKAALDLPGGASVWKEGFASDGRRLFFVSSRALSEGGRESALLVARFGPDKVTVEPVYRKAGSFIRFLPFLRSDRSPDCSAVAFLTMPARPDPAQPSCTLFKLSLEEPPVVTEIEKSSEPEYKWNIAWDGDRPHIATR